MILPWSMALLVVLVGVLGLVRDSWPRQILGPWIDIHALFGLLLWGLLIAEFYRRMKCSPVVLPADIREFSRRLARMVYLLLYVIIGVRQILGLVNYTWHDGAFDFDLFGEYFRRGPDGQGFDAGEDFQAFVAYGLVAIVIIRVVAFGIRLRLDNDAAAVKAVQRNLNESPES
jgi:cytochrome b561